MLIAVREEFSMTDAAYRSEDYTINVSFSEPKYDNFRLFYCRIYLYHKTVFKRTILEQISWKLPKDRICKEDLMSNWDNLDLSWNAQDILGCILPNDPKQFALINTCRFIQRPILHWETVHQEKRKPKKIQMSLLASVPTATSSQTSNTSTISSTSTSATFSSSELFSMEGKLSSQPALPVKHPWNN